MSSYNERQQESFSSLALFFTLAIADFSTNISNLD